MAEFLGSTTNYRTKFSMHGSESRELLVYKTGRLSEVGSAGTRRNDITVIELKASNPKAACYARVGDVWMMCLRVTERLHAEKIGNIQGR